MVIMCKLGLSLLVMPEEFKVWALTQDYWKQLNLKLSGLILK